MTADPQERSFAGESGGEMSGLDEEASLAFHIRQFVPAADGEELEHRAALLKARDYAAANAIALCGA